jgi:hypothetical protein
MTVKRAFAIIIASALCFAVGGAAIGYTIGVTTPGYYRAVFASGKEPWFQPTHVGFGLGLTQGLIAGVIVGSVVVLAVSWYNSHKHLPSRDED